VRVLVTGGAGYIGSHCLRLLAQRGIQTLTFDNLECGHPNAVTGALFRGDLRSPADLDQALGSGTFDAVMHFAALVVVEESVSEPERYFQVNTVGTLNLLEAMRKHDVKNFIFSSTAAVYGEPEKMPLTEDAPRQPVNPYGLSKVCAEDTVHYYERQHGMRAVIFRYFNAAGREFPYPGEQQLAHDTHLLARVLNVAAGRTPNVKIFGTDYNTKDGTCVRDYVHVTDIAKAHLLAVDYLARGGGNAVLNIGTNQGYTVREFVESCRAVTGHAIPVIEAPRRAGDPPALVAGNAALRETLDWQPDYNTLESIVNSAWKWHSVQGAAEASR
jgi:UDP-glucose 4-epimerase